MSRSKGGYQIAGRAHPSGFCQLCWKFTEERAAGVAVKKLISGNRKYVRDWEPIKPIAASEQMHVKAQDILKRFIAESKKSGGFTVEEQLYTLIPSFHYSTKILDSPELLVAIENAIIKRELYKKVLNLNEDGEFAGEYGQNLIKQFSVNPVIFNSDHNPNIHIKMVPSSSFCSDHNPKRSPEARRCYQNDRKRTDEYEKEINRLFADPKISRFAMDSDEDLQAILKTAYHHVFSSNLEKIKQLKIEGKKQNEIAELLQITPQAVSNALRREKNKTH
jgi:DNA-binding CsgD family transcriptional regulator